MNDHPQNGRNIFLTIQIDSTEDGLHGGSHQPILHHTAGRGIKVNEGIEVFGKANPPKVSVGSPSIV